ncbi:MAG: peptide deformylase [Planctomycetota bacterium]
MKVLTYPNPKLLKKALKVAVIDRSVNKLVRQMFDLMYKEGGVGLAAPQAGYSLRLAVINLTKKPPDELVLINPLIAEQSGSVIQEEGCLSVPGITAPVGRSARLVCRALDLNGNEINLTAEDLLARAIQHEIDHLDGVLFINRLEPEERQKIKKKLQELEHANNQRLK